MDNNYLKKLMFERSNGVDIDKLSTSELLRQIKLIPVLFIVTIVLAIVSGLLGVILLAMMLTEESDMTLIMLPLMFIISSLLVTFIAFILPKRLKNVKFEIDKREIDEKIQKDADKKIAETKKASIIGLIILLGVCIAFVVMMVSGLFSNGGSNEGGCKNCGRDSKLVAGYDICYDCFDGYLEWEERNNSKN